MITGLGSAKDLASGKKGAFYNTLEEFHKYWDRIDIIAPRIRGQESGVKNLFGNVYIHISPWPLAFHPVWFLKKGLEIYREQKFDLMTVQEFPPFYNGIGAWLLWQKIRVPYVLEIHHIPGYPKAAGLKEKIYANQALWKFYWRIFGSKARAVRVVNKKQAPDFLIEAGISKEKIVYISSAYIDLEVFKPINLPKEYDLIFVGRLERNKGIELFIDAAKIINAKALIIGSGSLSAEIKYKIQDTKYDIRLHGWAKDSSKIAELINKSKVLVMPSYNEGGPRVVLEAMACGVPVLATPVGIVPDIIKDKESGRIISWNAEDIATKRENCCVTRRNATNIDKPDWSLLSNLRKKRQLKTTLTRSKTLFSYQQFTIVLCPPHIIIKE